ncbi:MAG: GldG family protein [Alphaproteobacteria bacterium]|nr:GldG family protein [Alphaproteobacteria bacterium]MCB9696055.1 GldG family protein [Alphaproteobacteria bacterium]
MTRLSLLREEWVRTACWVALALAAVDLGSALGARLDLTSDGRYGLSDAAIESVSHLERPLTVQVWFSEDLDPPYHQHRQALLDLLTDLGRHADGQLRVDVVDPTGDPELVAQAARSGVRPLPYAFRSWDRTETRSVFMGASLDHGDRHVVIGALPSLEHLELDVVRAIRAVTTEPADRPSIGWWLGHGEPDPTTAPDDSPVADLRRQLVGRGSFRTVPGMDVGVPDDVDLLLVVAPRDPIPTVDLVHLDQFLMRGGRVAVFASGVVPDLQRLTLSESEHGLRPWLGRMGAVLGDQVLFDRDDNEVLALPVAAGGRRQLVRVHHPLALVTTRLDRAVSAVRDLPRVVLPFASPVSLAEPLPEGVEGEVWVWTDDDAVARSGLRSLDPAALEVPDPTERTGSFPVMVALSGRFPSLFVGRELPERLDREAPPFEDLRTTSEPTRIAVVGSADAVANDPVLVANTVDWLLEDEALIGIRGRGAPEVPMEAPSREQALRLKAAMVGAPLLLIALGALATRRRSG